MQDIHQIIMERKSTRCFDESYEVQHQDVETILGAGMRAPSPKNRQPWFFTVVTGDRREVIVKILDTKIQKLKKSRVELEEDITDLTMAETTINVMRQASVLIFVSYERDELVKDHETMQWEIQAQGVEVTDIQALGAAIENMILQAESMGIDSLWIGDILYAQKELREYLLPEYPLIAVVAFGKAEKMHSPRKQFDEKVLWLS